MAWTSSLQCNCHSLMENMYNRLAHQTQFRSCLHGRRNSINRSSSQWLNILQVFPLVLRKFIIAWMAFSDIRQMALSDIEVNPTMPAWSQGEWQDFLSKCNSDVDVLAACWDVDPGALRASCEEGAKMDGMSDLHVEAICGPSFLAAEAPNHHEAKLLMWIYCELEPWATESEFLSFSRTCFEDLAITLSVKVWSGQVHMTAAKHCANTIKKKGLSLAMKKMQAAVESGTFHNDA
jgi:hypothetical protein